MPPNVVTRHCACIVHCNVIKEAHATGPSSNGLGSVAAEVKWTRENGTMAWYIDSRTIKTMKQDRGTLRLQIKTHPTAQSVGIVILKMRDLNIGIDSLPRLSFLIWPISAPLSCVPRLIPFTFTLAREEG